jgi:hypothetical protein
MKVNVPLKTKGNKLTDVKIVEGKPSRLSVEWGKVCVRQTDSSFKSAWRKNLKVLGGSPKGSVRNRLLWKLASMITRYGLKNKNLKRLSYAYKLLQAGKHIGWSRVVDQLVGKGKGVPALLTE